MKNNNIITTQNTSVTPLVDDLRQIINEARNRVAVNVNAELTLMYWHIGERINREVLGNERAELIILLNLNYIQEVLMVLIMNGGK